MYMAVIPGDGPLRSHNDADMSDWITDLQKINTHKHSVMFTQLGLVIETWH